MQVDPYLSLRYSHRYRLTCVLFHFQFGIYSIYIYIYIYKVKWSRYRPGVAQRLGRVIALLFHDRGTRRGWMVSSTPLPHFTPGKDPVPILQEAGWVPGLVCTDGKSRTHRDSIPDPPAHSQSLYRLSYPAHIYIYIYNSDRILSLHLLWTNCWPTKLLENLISADFILRLPMSFNIKF